MSKSVEVTVNACINIYEDLTFSLDSFLNEDEAQEVLDNPYALSDYSVKLERRVEELAYGEQDVEYSEVELVEDEVSCEATSDYNVTKQIVITEEMTAQEFLNALYEEMPNRDYIEGEYSLGFADIYPEQTQQYEHLESSDFWNSHEKRFELEDEGDVLNQFEEFKRELLQLEAEKELSSESRRKESVERE